MFPQGPFIIAQLLKVPVYQFFCVKNKGKYEVTLHKLSDGEACQRKDRSVFINSLCAKYTKQLEQYCLNDPWQWYNFYEFWKKKNDSK